MRLGRPDQHTVANDDQILELVVVREMHKRMFSLPDHKHMKYGTGFV
jgi:hypothetical protein